MEIAVEESFLSIKLFAPEIILVASIALIFILDALFRNFKKSYSILFIVGIFSLASLIASIYLLSFNMRYFSEALINDGFSVFFRSLFFIISFFSIYLAFFSKEINENYRSEFAVLILSAIFGMSLMVLASNFLILYIGVETVSIISYVIAGFKRGDLKSNEASFKYLIFGAVSSALMLYGISVIYGLTGSIYYTQVHSFIVNNSEHVGVVLPFSLILVYAGMAYKISAFPFHFWTPDIYEGSPTPVTAFLSVGPKIAGFGALIRLFFEVFSKKDPSTFLWQPISEINLDYVIAIISAITMFIGNLSAINQTSVKRMLAYSSIAHVGYVLIGFTGMDSFGIRAMLFYLVAYFLMNFGAFWVLSIVNDLEGNDELSSFRSLGLKMPLLGVCMVVFLFSLTGIPMFAGFIGKFFLFSVAVKKSGYLWLAILGVINSVISLYYYLKIVKMMWLEKSECSQISISNYHTIGILVLAIPTVFLGLYFLPLTKAIEMIFNFVR